jgi:23S rRNA (cytosine1962-C5)-methyltransferase
LLVIHKPPGINTHAASADSSEGIYDWLKRREPRWAGLSILQRLDKETSGVLVFGKTRLANQSLGRQFETRTLRKTYLLLTDRDPGTLPRIVSSGDGTSYAETEFRRASRDRDRWRVEALPRTGRTHQVRLHARDAGFPILGDERYGGSPHSRLCLHAESLEFDHPASGDRVRVSAALDFDIDASVELCELLWPEPATNAWRLVHASAEGETNFVVERYGDWLESQSEREPTPGDIRRLERWCTQLGLCGAYHKRLDRHVRGSDAESASPVLISGEPAPERFEVRENGVRFLASFREGYSTGLFLDQRDNRRRLLTGYVFPKGADAAARGPESTFAGASVLNTFAYTCSFSVAAAVAGATVTSLDLSRKYLDWGRENFRLNGIDPAAHDFIYGDCFDWMKRLAKKNRLFDLVLLDPPTFSQSKQSGAFRADKDYGRLVALALALLSPRGLLFCSTNSATFPRDAFLEVVRREIEDAGRQVLDELFVTQPPDFPTGRGRPGYLKTVWLRVA